VLYLLWKALDFEQIFEVVNSEKNDLAFQLVQLMNEDQRREYETMDDVPKVSMLDKFKEL
jgi:hypothetical protein